MHFLIIGCNGQLGTDMMSCVQRHGHTVKGIDYPDLDITNSAMVETFIDSNHADVCINCSGYTAVDACETHEKEAFAVNAVGVAHLARSTHKSGTRLVHLSTDYVFNGNKQSAYIESDIPDPQSVYGRSKFAGEQEIAAHHDNFQIFRIAWLYGRYGNNFVKTIRTVAKKNGLANIPLKVVNDQHGSPTYSIQVCEQILAMSGRFETGIFHCTSEGSCSWFDFASYIVKKADINVDVLPCTTAEFPRPAHRPANGVLENARLKNLGLNLMTDWSLAFDQFLLDEKATKRSSVIL